MEPTFAKKAKEAGIPIEAVSSSQTDLRKIKIINRAIHVLEPVISALVEFDLERLGRHRSIHVIVSTSIDRFRVSERKARRK